MKQPKDEYGANGLNYSVPLAPNHPTGPNSQPIWRAGTDSLINHHNFFDKKDEVPCKYTFGINDMLYYNPLPGSFAIASNFDISQHPTGVRLSDHFVVTIMADGLANRRANLFYSADVTAQGKIRKNGKHFGHGAFHAGLPIMLDAVIYHGEHYKFTLGDRFKEMHNKNADPGPGKLRGRENLPRPDDPVSGTTHAPTPPKSSSAISGAQIHQEKVNGLVAWAKKQPNRSNITEDFLYQTFGAALPEHVIGDAIVALSAANIVQRQHQTPNFKPSLAATASQNIGQLT
jgi:hypothetical protein